MGSATGSAYALKQEQQRLYTEMGEILERADDGWLKPADARAYDETERRFEEVVEELGRMSGDGRHVVSRGAPGVIGPDDSSRGFEIAGDSLGGLMAAEFRGLLEASGSGSYIVPVDYSTRLFDRLAAASVGLRSGFTVIATDSDELHVPKVTADAGASWTAEAATISATDPTLDEVIARPRKLAALVEMSNEIIRDSNPAVLEVVAGNLIRSLALKLDLGFFQGSGVAPEIRGLVNTSGISEVSMGTNGAVFSDLDPFADSIGTLEESNAQATAIVMHPRSWKKLLKLKEQTTGHNKPLLQESAGAATSGVQRSIYGVPVFLTSQLSITETQGTSNDCSSVYVYQADQIVAVRRQETELRLDGSRLFNSDQSELRAISRWDLAVPHPAAVVRIKGIKG